MPPGGGCPAPTGRGMRRRCAAPPLGVPRSTPASRGRPLVGWRRAKRCSASLGAPFRRAPRRQSRPPRRPSATRALSAPPPGQHLNAVRCLPSPRRAPLRTLCFPPWLPMEGSSTRCGPIRLRTPVPIPPSLFPASRGIRFGVTCRMCLGEWRCPPTFLSPLALLARFTHRGAPFFASSKHSRLEGGGVEVLVGFGGCVAVR